MLLLPKLTKTDCRYDNFHFDYLMDIVYAMLYNERNRLETFFQFSHFKPF